MLEVIQILNLIKNTSSINEKKKIIMNNKNNELFKKCLFFLLNGYPTGLSAKKIKKKVIKSEYILPTFEDVMKYLAQNNTGTDNDISMVQAFLDGHEEDRDFYEQMITKSFRLGADNKIMNACIPNLIPTFDVQLGTSIEKVKLLGNEKIFISRKLNGTRTAFVGDKCMTRQGKEYKGLDHIISDLQKVVGTEMFVDGELLYKNKEGLSDSEAFQKGTGIAMSKDNDKSELKLVIFDMFPLDEFWSGKSKEPYSNRKKYLIELGEKITALGTDNLEIVQMCYEGYDHSEIWKWLDYAERHDWEGVILNLDTPYECKRTKNLIKVKKFKEIDLRCININIATTGKYKGVMGSITCKYGDSTVDVGSGFNDEKRIYYTDNPKEIIDHIISIKYKEETINKNGGKSLQFPIFIDCRFDKSVADDECF